MNKTLAVLFAALMMVSSGCAEKTESEKLKDEIARTDRQLKKDLKKATDQMNREMEALQK